MEPVRLAVEHHTLPMLDPLAARSRLAERFGADRVFLMESLNGPAADTRASLCGLAGRAEVSVRRGVVTLRGEEAVVERLHAYLAGSGLVAEAAGVLTLISPDVLWELPAVLRSAFAPDASATGLAAGFLTFFGYDAVHYIEALPRTIEDCPDGPPDAVFALVDALVTIEADAADLAVVRSDAWDPLDAAELAALMSDARAGGEPALPPVPAPRKVTDDITREEYEQRGQVCLEHIRAGDIYQVQLGHSIRVETDADPETVYERMRLRNPSPYMALLTLGGATVVCASPELFVRFTDGHAVMRPIAGTAARGGDEEATARALVADEKERAEHVMLVDLCRNDLGRVAVPGSLDVTRLMVVEKYSHVMHIVSEVACDVAESNDAYALVRAGFPAGTMSGAPKVRAMEIIESLETSRRGFYAGAFGLISLTGDEALLGLAIRMAVHRGDTYTLRASAGFVADSTTEGEWNETLKKMASAYWAVTGEEIA